MKIFNLTEHSTTYTSNAYLVLGDWNTLEDKNTLIDVGRDPEIIHTINNAATGVGKKKIDQIIITHNHYDHAGMLAEIKSLFKPQIYAFSGSVQEADHLVADGDRLRIGDNWCEILHTPGHSTDSICIYCEQNKVLFVGDTPVIINSVHSTYAADFIHALEKLLTKEITTIYFGHGQCLRENCNARISKSLENIKVNLEEYIYQPY
ncbi:MBL fold metallo-hydrolase [candidate division KSB1 bacterium]|nr:MBL fold metallo-hydrolase [candidate division KSB1 bacterium]